MSKTLGEIKIGFVNAEFNKVASVLIREHALSQDVIDDFDKSDVSLGFKAKHINGDGDIEWKLGSNWGNGSLFPLLGSGYKLYPEGDEWPLDPQTQEKLPEGTKLLRAQFYTEFDFDDELKNKWHHIVNEELISHVVAKDEAEPSYEKITSYWILTDDSKKEALFAQAKDQGKALVIPRDVDVQLPVEELDKLKLWL